MARDPRPRSPRDMKLVAAMGGGVAVLLALVFVGWSLRARGGDVAADFQRDADLVRLNHLEYYGALLDEYEATTGAYPLQSQSNVPTYVFVAHGDQLGAAPPGPPYEHRVVSFADFHAELEAGLGRDLEERYDPQLRATHRPNFYVYMITGDAFFFAVHLHFERPFAERVADGYHKVEISNLPNATNGALDPALLFERGAFRSEADQQIRNPGFFADREGTYLHYARDLRRSM